MCDGLNPVEYGLVCLLPVLGGLIGYLLATRKHW